MNETIENNRDDELDLRQVAMTLWRYRWIILISMIVGGVISAYIAYFKPNIYETTATVEVQVKNPWGWGRQNAVNAALTGGTVSSLDTEIRIIQSRFVTAKALKQVDFAHHYFIKHGFKKKELYKASPFMVELTRGYGIHFILEPIDTERFRLEAKLPGGGHYNAVHRYGEEIRSTHFVLVVRKKPGYKITEDRYFFWVDNPAKLPAQLSGRVKAKALGKRATIIAITFSDTVPLRDQEFTNALAKAYLKQNIERRTLEAEKTLEFIDSQLKTLAENLKISAANLERFQRKSQTIDVDKKVERLSKQLGEYEAQMTTLQLQEDILKSMLKKVKRGKNLETLTLAGIGIQDESLAGIIADLREAILKKKELLRDYTSAYPEVKKLSARIAQLRQIIIQSVGNLYHSVKEKEKFLQVQMDKFHRQLASLPEDQRNFLALQRRFASNEKFYSYLMEKKTETEIRKASTVSANRILDTALYPSTPVKPKRKLIVLVGLILGLIVGIAYAFLHELFDDKIHNEEELEVLTEVPKLGIVPHFGKGVSEMVVFDNPKSAAAEAFRGLRTNLLFMSPREEGQVVAVTSTVGGEGKTTLCTNLGGIMGLAGKRVIILNLDMRKPTLHQKFALPNQKGLSNLLSGHATLKEVIQSTKYENLDIISSGPIPPNPSELIGGEILPEAIKVLRKHYDVVLLDTPPVGLVTDARMIMQMVDITCYVFRAGFSRKPYVRTLNELYAMYGRRGFGYILNDFDPKRHGGYGYKYGYGYYGEEDKQTKKRVQ